MKVFISHQQRDSSLASDVSRRLLYIHSVESYLDILDPQTPKKGEVLGEYIKEKLQACSHLLAVVSEHSKTSWWVPWEIGIATERSLPLATYAGESCELPYYLRRWPYLRRMTDLDAYAEEVKRHDRRVAHLRKFKSLTEAQSDAIGDFYRNLRSTLGQTR